MIGLTPPSLLSCFVLSFAILGLSSSSSMAILGVSGRLTTAAKATTAAASVTRVASIALVNYTGGNISSIRSTVSFSDGILYTVFPAGMTWGGNPIQRVIALNLSDPQNPNQMYTLDFSDPGTACHYHQVVQSIGGYMAMYETCFYGSDNTANMLGFDPTGNQICKITGSRFQFGGPDLVPMAPASGSLTPAVFFYNNTGSYGLDITTGQVFDPQPWWVQDAAWRQNAPSFGPNTSQRMTVKTPVNATTCAPPNSYIPCSSYSVLQVSTNKTLINLGLHISYGGSYWGEDKNFPGTYYYFDSSTSAASGPSVSAYSSGSGGSSWPGGTGVPKVNFSVQFEQVMDGWSKLNPPPVRSSPEGDEVTMAGRQPSQIVVFDYQNGTLLRTVQLPSNAKLALSQNRLAVWHNKGEDQDSGSSFSVYAYPGGEVLISNATSHLHLDAYDEVSVLGMSQSSGMIVGQNKTHVDIRSVITGDSVLFTTKVRHARLAELTTPQEDPQGLFALLSAKEEGQVEVYQYS